MEEQEKNDSFFDVSDQDYNELDKKLVEIFISNLNK